MVKIAPSILSADFARLAGSVKEVEHESDLIHVDVMDGHFVPNLTIGPPVVASLRTVTSLPLDCHLMISDPGGYIEQFAQAGADSCTIHIEAVPDPPEVFARFDGLGLGRGLALNPDTPFEAIRPFVELVDMVLVMTVQPGFGGQAFREDVLPKIEQCAEYIRNSGLNTEIEVDGGVSASTVEQVAAAGGSVLVAGSAIFGAAEPDRAAAEIRRLAGEARSEPHAAGPIGEKRSTSVVDWKS